jgi:hypothetical protein
MCVHTMLTQTCALALTHSNHPSYATHTCTLTHTGAHATYQSHVTLVTPHTRAHMQLTRVTPQPIVSLTYISSLSNMTPESTTFFAGLRFDQSEELVRRLYHSNMKRISMNAAMGTPMARRVPMGIVPACMCVCVCVYVYVCVCMCVCVIRWISEKHVFMYDCTHICRSRHDQTGSDWNIICEYICICIRIYIYILYMYIYKHTCISSSKMAGTFLVYLASMYVYS